MCVWRGGGGGPYSVLNMAANSIHNSRQNMCNGVDGLWERDRDSSPAFSAILRRANGLFNGERGSEKE